MVLHQVIVLGARPRDAGGVAFLEGVVADQVGRHLPGEADQWDAVHQSIGQPGHGIRRSGTGCDQNRPDLAGRPRIAFGCVNRPAFLADKNVADRILFEQGIIKRKYRATRIAENNIDTLID